MPKLSPFHATDHILMHDVTFQQPPSARGGDPGILLDRLEPLIKTQMLE